MAELIDSAPKKSRREEYTEATRSSLIEAARIAFAEHGFAGASAEAISRSARVTRGAFYHHFADKTALFDAVVVSMQVEAASEIARSVSGKKSLWGKVEAGIEAYLAICVRFDYARIVVLEASSVLGSKRFHEIDEAHVGALFHQALAAAAARKELTYRGDVLMLARGLDAVICRVATLLVDAPNQASVLAEGRSVIKAMLQGLRVKH